MIRSPKRKLRIIVHRTSHLKVKVDNMSHQGQVTLIAEAKTDIQNLKFMISALT